MAKARVLVTLEIELQEQWDNTATINDIQKKALEEITSTLKWMVQNAASEAERSIKMVHEPRVQLIITDPR